MIYGHFIGGGDRPAGHAAYAWRGRSWSRIDRRAWDGPWSLAEDRGAAVLFEPRPFHLENGMLPAPPPNEPADRCAPRGKVALGEIVTSPANRRAPQVDKRFFPMKIATDGASRMMTWGYFGCEPGAFAGRVDGGAVTLERLPGTEACTVRDPTNGLPLVTASLFPAADGGAYALVASGLRYDEQSVPYTSRVGEPSVPCIPAPLRLRRGKTGGWIKVGASLPPGTLSGMRVVSSSAIDPAGTAFLVASPTTVLRVDASGAIEELGVTRACLALPSSGEAGEEPRDDQAAEIERVIATAPDDVWIVVSHRDHGQGVCRARFGTTKP